MRAGRLLAILSALQSEGRVSAGELARRLEVSERTVLRDLEELGATGVPVYAVRGRGGGFELLDTFRPGEAPPGGAGAAMGAAMSAAGRLRRVRVRIAPAALQRALVVGSPAGWRARPFPDTSAEHPDWVEGSFRFGSDGEAISALLALAPDVEVLLPLELRAAMADVAERVAAQHRPPSPPPTPEPTTRRTPRRTPRQTPRTRVRSGS